MAVTDPDPTRHAGLALAGPPLPDRRVLIPFACVFLILERP